MKSIVDEAVKNLKVKLVIFKRTEAQLTDAQPTGARGVSLLAMSADARKSRTEKDLSKFSDDLRSANALQAGKRPTLQSKEIDFTDLLNFPDECEADVVDADGNSVEAGVGGRLVLRRPFPSMMRSVWNDAPRYERMWKQVAGCYVSGDVAVKDADGYIQVLGRADDVLNIAGHRIGTADVESALVSHPTVAEAAVIGIPDQIKGEAIIAFVQLRSGAEESDELLKTLSAPNFRRLPRRAKSSFAPICRKLEAAK